MLRLAVGTVAFSIGAFGVIKAKTAIERTNNQSAHLNTAVGAPLPSRADLLKDLKATPEYDVLVIGGGATGAGVALDAVSRGLKTALVEKYDYACGTSSRSTKLIHGGVRYLQKAIFNLDIVEYKLVKEALHERANLLQIAPHLSDPLPIMLPVYKWWQVPYFWAGIKMYDLVAGRKLVKSSYFVNKEKALELFPMLKSENLCGAIIYYDGQHNDSRMNLAIALTAIRRGATCLNHVEVEELLKKKIRDENDVEKEVVCGARVRDGVTGEEWDVHAKSVVNATGPFTDSVRRMGDEKTPKICQASAGVHIVLPDYYSPNHMGLLDPATSDGRVIFFLPWEGKTIAGTTDAPCDVTFSPAPREKEVQFILNEIKNYLSPDVHVRRGDVLAAWSGIRPLVIDPSSQETKSISRNHVIEISDNNLITIAGGKWTTYRAMAKDTVDAARKRCDLKAGESQTDGLMLEGADGWTPTFFIRLVQDFGLEPEVATHLSKSYGNNAPQVAKLAKLTGKRWPVVGQRLIDEFPYIEAEILYGIQEYALTAVDMIARRLRIAFLNVQAADEILPRVIEIMGNELGWDETKRVHELTMARKFLDNMGYMNRVNIRDVPLDLPEAELERYKKVFHSFDVDNSGHLTVISLRNVFESLGDIKFSDEQLQSLIHEVDLDMSSTIDLEEFLKLVSALKSGTIANSRLGTLVKRQYEEMFQTIPTERSGGGV
eukprot:Seg1964.6 transcript_id=Seg1964.6/GoldUCD/mRNA.D3Y31 product="Glycerol-3-phosphate dehydrogenase mitochondrial" protein_id=Seg1964.6/GoldUCD/D3Y31